MFGSGSLGQSATILLILSAATLGAVAIHKIVMLLLRRFAAQTPSKADELVVSRVAPPLRFIILGVAWSLVQNTVPLPSWLDALWRQCSGFFVPALIGWLAIALIRAASDIVDLRNDISVVDQSAPRSGLN